MSKTLRLQGTMSKKDVYCISFVRLHVNDLYICFNPAIVPKYLSCVANSMLCHKLYPTREDYIRVANEIIKKHVWMKSKLGSATVSERN